MLSKKSMAKKRKNKQILELLTFKEACDILKCHPNTLRQWDRKGIWLLSVLARKRTGVITKKTF